MATTRDLIAETRSHLRDPETLNELAALDATQTVVTFQRATKGVSEGTLLSVDLETCYVWSVDTAAKTAEVRRGHEGSTAAIHTAGALVRVGPGHSDFAILRALNAEIRALSGMGLGPVKTLALTTSSTGVRTYNLATDVIGVVDVRYDADSTGNEWPQIHSWTWLPDMPTAEFAAGNALRLDAPVPSGRPLRVFYKAPLVTLATLADDVATVTGLAASALDIPPLGAAWRLTAGAEVERNQTHRQGDSRRADEVPPGAKMRSTLQLQQARDARIREEKANLAREWPSRSR